MGEYFYDEGGRTSEPDEQLEDQYQLVEPYKLLALTCSSDVYMFIKFSFVHLMLSAYPLIHLTFPFLSFVHLLFFF